MMLYIEALKLDLVGVNVCFATLFAGLLYYLLIAPIVNGPLSHLSGPILCKLSRYYLSYYDITLQRTHKVHEWHIKYGPVICIGPGEVSVATPELMREIYGSSGKYAKSQFFDHFVAWGERALFAIRPYAAHQQKRKLMSAFYHNINKPAVEAFIQERVTAVVKQIDKRQDETPSLDIFPMASHFAFDNISRLLHGHLYCTYTVEKDCEERRILTGLKDAQLWGPFKFDFPWIYNHIHGSLTLLNRLPYSLKADDDLMYWSYNRVTEIIADQKVVDGEEDILLCRLLNTKELDGSPLNLNYVHSELYDNLNAAQVTVAVTFTYIIYHLSGNSIWQRRIRVELLSLPCETTGLPSFASVNAAPLLNAFIREVYRMNPGTGGHAERVVPNGGKTYDGIYVPGGVSLPHQPPCNFTDKSNHQVDRPA